MLFYLSDVTHLMMKTILFLILKTKHQISPPGCAAPVIDLCLKVLGLDAELNSASNPSNITNSGKKAESGTNFTYVL